jgi:Carbohydrate binding domain/Secretion system C-terminal sorting domain
MKKIFIFILTSLTTFALAQNFTNGFNFNLPYDDGTASVFLPDFPKKALNTEGDRVAVKGEDFIVNGKPYRFWGVNITAQGAFPPKTEASKIATRLRKMGINLVRFHHLDNPCWYGCDLGSIFKSQANTSELNPNTLDKLMFFINELKKNGIYSNINLNVGRTFTTNDGVVGADSLIEFAKGVTVFDPQLITLQKEYAQKLLKFPNPYSNTTLADDPSVAIVEIINENSLYGFWKDDALKHIKNGGILLQRHISFLDSEWNSFLTQKYQTQTALQAAWALSNTTMPVDRVENGNFESTILGNKWQMEQHNGAVASVGIDAIQKFNGTRSAKVDIATATGTGWHVQLKFVNFSFKKDTSYIVKFTAKASKNRSIDATLMRDNDPYTWFGGQSFNITTDWQTFQFTLKPSEDINGVGRISFGLGQDNGSVWFDDVSFSEPIISNFNPGENLGSKNIKRVLYSERLNFTKQRMADLAEFYIMLQKNFMEDMRSYLKTSLGVKSPITGTNALVGIQEGMEHEQMDFYDDHSYWDHPQFPNQPWDNADWLQNNKSMLNDNASAITQAINGIALADKPFTVSEYNNPFPNRFKTEMVHAIAAYGSFHGMNGIMFFEYQGDSFTTDVIPNYFNNSRDPSVMALFPSCAYAYRNNLIAKAKQPILVNYSRKDIFNSFEKDNNGRWGKYVPYDLKLQLTHSIRTKTYNSATDFTPSVLPQISNNIFETDTKETILNNSKGVLTTNTPNFAAVSGFLADAANTVLGNMTLISGSDFGALTWLSLNNNKILATADTTLLTISSKAQNTGMVWNATNTSINNKWGTAPTQIAPLDVKLRFTLAAETITINLLSPTGQLVSSKTITPISTQGNNKVFETTFSQASDKTLWYALVVKRSSTGLKNTESQGFLDIMPNPAQNTIKVKYSLNQTTNLDLIISDTNGKRVLTQHLKPNALITNEIDVDISGFKSGIYFISVGGISKKIVVAK